MECKYSHTECFVHIITVDFEELRACDLGVTCNFRESTVPLSID